MLTEIAAFLPVAAIVICTTDTGCVLIGPGVRLAAEQR
jgi:hypothetical protein